MRILLRTSKYDIFTIIESKIGYKYLGYSDTSFIKKRVDENK